MNGDVSRSSLTINPLLPGDNGAYVCRADNDGGSSTTTGVHVEVQCELFCVIDLIKVFTRVWPCMAVQCYPSTIPETNLPFISAHGMLILIRQVFIWLSEAYQVLLFSHTVKPILEAFSEELRWMVGSTATLQTRLVSANPNTGITVRWLNPSGGVIPSSQYSMSGEVTGSVVYGVTLPDLTETSEGVYTCEVNNSIGTSTQTFHIVVTGQFSCKQCIGIHIYQVLTKFLLSNHVVPFTCTYSLAPIPSAPHPQPH